MKIIFFGTHKFAATILENLIAHPNLEVDLVVTQPDKPIGRDQKIQKPPVKLIAEKYNLKIEQPASLKNQEIKIKGQELGILAQYGLLIPKRILEAFKFGIINVHPSLLPKYRGASPLQSAILQGETETGVTIMKLDEGMDTGPILLQKSLSIEKDDTSSTLEEKVAVIAKELILEAILKYTAGEINPQPQDNSLATYCKLLTREDGKIDWQKTGQEIYNQWRALQPWPGIWGELTIANLKNRIKIHEIKLLPEEAASEVGNFIKISKSRLGIVCGDKKIIEVIKLQPEGKKIMTAQEFINGFRIT